MACEDFAAGVEAAGPEGPTVLKPGGVAIASGFARGYARQLSLRRSTQATTLANGNLKQAIVLLN